MVTDVLIVLVVAAFVAALFRRPHRRDLVYLTGGLVVGTLVQAVVGGIVVLTKLNPYWVMVHLLATMVLLANAIVLVHRSNRNYDLGSGRLLVPRPLLQLQFAVLVLLAVVVAAGAATSGAGPWRATPKGKRWLGGSPLLFVIWRSSTPRSRYFSWA
jgi:cytochrome c oxidase assembly protein subunit 15